MARHLLRTQRFLAQKVLHTNDTPHTIALGASLAMFVTFLPLVGLQTVISVFLAGLFRANKAICLPIVWITNPLTMLPIYGACWGLGRWLLPENNGPDGAAVLAKLKQLESSSIWDLAFWTGLLSTLPDLGLELWVGCTVVASVSAIIAYFVARWGVSNYRERRRLRMLRRTQFRSNLKPGKVIRRSNAL